MMLKKCARVSPIHCNHLKHCIFIRLGLGHMYNICSNNVMCNRGQVENWLPELKGIDIFAHYFLTNSAKSALSQIAPQLYNRVSNFLSIHQPETWVFLQEMTKWQTSRVEQKAVILRGL